MPIITTPDGQAISESNPLFVEVVNPDPKPLMIAGVTAAAAGVTITLPAPGAGLFHYISSISLCLYTTATRTGGATPTTVSSTNLNGWGETMGTAGATGTTDRFLLSVVRPIQSQTANTATTIVLPAATGALWRYTVIYAVGE